MTRARPYRPLTNIPYPEFGVYPTLRPIPYPQPGTANSSARIGVVPAVGGETRWMQVPGYAERNYIARMDWAGDSDSLIMQHLNRLQNTNDVLLADVRTGAVQSVYRDEDKAWVDVVDHEKWIHGGKDFLWISERDGWRHVYIISRDGKQVTLATPGAFDVTDLLGADPQEKWLYYIASPENPTQRYLFRSPLSGKGSPERVTPTSQPGTHSYDISPDFHWALHTYSTFNTPPSTDLLRPLRSETAARARRQREVARAGDGHSVHPDGVLSPGHRRREFRLMPGSSGRRISILQRSILC